MESFFDEMIGSCCGSVCLQRLKLGSVVILKTMDEMERSACFSAAYEPVPQTTCCVGP